MDILQLDFLKSQIGHVNVLYVEDEEIVRDATVRLLECFFSNVITAQNGEEGLELFHQYNDKVDANGIGLVITDIKMPKLDGLEMVKHIKSFNQRIPVLFISAHEKTEYFLSSINMGIDGYMIKPLDSEDFMKHILNVTKKYFLNDYIYLDKGYVWDCIKKELYCNNETIKLTKNEMKLIDLLINTEQVVSSDSIENYIFDDLESSNKRVRNLISRLHTKLDYYIIESVYGMGYKIKLSN